MGLEEQRAEHLARLMLDPAFLRKCHAILRAKDISSQDWHDIINESGVVFLAQYDPTMGQAEPFFCGVLRNKCLEYKRVRRRIAKNLAVGANQSNAHHLHQHAHHLHQRARFRLYFVYLSCGDRLIVELSYLKNVPDAQVAKQLNIGQGALRKRKYDVKQRLCDAEKIAQSQEFNRSNNKRPVLVLLEDPQPDINDTQVCDLNGRLYNRLHGNCNTMKEWCTNQGIDLGKFKKSVVCTLFPVDRLIFNEEYLSSSQTSLTPEFIQENFPEMTIPVTFDIGTRKKVINTLINQAKGG